MNDFAFNVILLVIILAFIAHRRYYIKKHGRPETDTLKKREESAVSKLAGLPGVAGFISMVAYIVNPGWLPNLI